MGAGGVARSKVKEGLFWGSDRITLTSVTDVNFTILTGPPLHAKYPGVFDRTGGDLSENRVHLGVCLIIIRERRSLHARIWGVVKSEKWWF
jgi:hypothetical protein